MFWALPNSETLKVQNSSVSYSNGIKSHMAMNFMGQCLKTIFLWDFKQFYPTNIYNQVKRFLNVIIETVKSSLCHEQLTQFPCRIGLAIYNQDSFGGCNTIILTQKKSIVTAIQMIVTG